MKQYGLIVILFLSVWLFALSQVKVSISESSAIYHQQRKSDAYLKTQFVDSFEAIPIDDDNHLAATKRWQERHNLDDNHLRRILMELAEDSTTAVQTEGDAEENFFNGQRLVRAIIGLAVCGDDTTKAYLLNVTESSELNYIYRVYALASYLILADGEETKDALIRFLVEGNRMDAQSRSSIVRRALMAYEEAGTAKKEAILHALYVSLASEDRKWLFLVYDEILTQISEHYAYSFQRLAILKRLLASRSLYKGDDYVRPKLNEKLRELKKLKLYTNINTNLSDLKARNFNLPTPLGPPSSTVETFTQPSDPAKRGAAQQTSFSIYAVVGVVLLALTATSVLIFRRRK